MSTRTPRYEVVINHIGIPCATEDEARAIAAHDHSDSARIYRRTRRGYEEIMIAGISGVSGLTGGNGTREEYDEIQREFASVAGWDGTLPQSQDRATGAAIRSELFRYADTCDCDGCRAKRQSQEAVSDGDLGQCADVQAWWERRS